MIPSIINFKQKWTLNICRLGATTKYQCMLGQKWKNCSINNFYLEQFRGKISISI